MKKLSVLVVLICSFLTLSAVAEQKEISAKRPSSEAAVTKLEAFYSKKGTLFIKDFYSVGELTSKHGSVATIQALVMFSPGREADRTKGLKMDIPGLQSVADVFIDQDEIPGIIKAITYQIDLASKWKDQEKHYTEVNYMTTGGLEVGFFQKGKEMTPYLSAEHGRLVFFFTSMEALVQTRTVFENGLKILGSK